MAAATGGQLEVLQWARDPLGPRMEHTERPTSCLSALIALFSLFLSTLLWHLAGDVVVVVVGRAHAGVGRMETVGVRVTWDLMRTHFLEW